jgi:hypothetical protein
MITEKTKTMDTWRVTAITTWESEEHNNVEGDGSSVINAQKKRMEYKNILINYIIDYDTLVAGT